MNAYDSFEEAVAERDRMASQMPEVPERDGYNLILNYLVVPETTGEDFEVDEDGWPPESVLTGRWLVRRFAAWKGWIAGRQYGNYVIDDAPESPLEPTWDALDENYRQTVAEVTQ